MNVETAWAAGFFEGEGCVSVNRRGDLAQPRLRLSLAQKYNRKTVERFQAAVGAGSICNKKAAVFEWTVQGAKAHAVMETLLPYLGLYSKKTDAFDEALLAGCRPEKSNGWETGARS